MNILPKKSWHVRNKDNVEKVRKDEEEARLQEKRRQQRIALAEQEARTELLRKKARSSDSSSVVAESSRKTNRGSINFFQDIGPDGKPYDATAKNEEHEKEKLKEKEKSEKKMGFLTYLGQSAVESLGDDDKPWYFKPPKRHYSDKKSSRDANETNVIDAKRKSVLDPLEDMKAHLKKKKKKHKKSKISNSISLEGLQKEDKLAKLRKARIEREAKEKQRSVDLLRKHYGGSPGQSVPSETSSFVPKFSNQFNPHLARNNKF